jgi:hypothetical protein
MFKHFLFELLLVLNFGPCAHNSSIAITYAHELLACFFLIESFELGTTSNVGGEGG